MKNNHWFRMLAAMMLAVMMLAGSTVGAAAEGADAAVVADLTESAVSEPVLLASVNGEEIWSNNEEMQQLIDYYVSYYSRYYGVDADDPTMQAFGKAFGLQWMVESILYTQKAAELKIPDMTEEQRAAQEAEAKARWEEIVSQYAEGLSSLTETSTEEEIAAARLNALAYIESNFGYTEESFVNEQVEDSRPFQLRKNVQEAVLGKIEVTEEEIVAHFNELVEEDKAQYEGNVPMYEYYTRYMGSNSYYVPEGYRGITHILLDVDDELMSSYTALSEELKNQGQAENTETPAEGENAGETAAEGTETAEPTEEPKEPVTQEMVDAAKQAIFDSVKGQVDEIMAKFQAGTSFDDLVDEYGTDPGMKTEPNKTDGYPVHKESILWDPAFTEGAMALEKVGDVSEPILGSSGVHILHYKRDIPAGAVEMTEEIRKQMEEEMLNEKETIAVEAMVKTWIAESEIVYTEEGQEIMDAVKAVEESVSTTDATEEVLADGQ